ncbi:MAG: guanine deaminase [Betaproteobacteria bacterium]
MIAASEITAIRGALVSFSGDPFVDGIAAACHHEPDGIVAMADGRIVDCGPARDVARRLPEGTAVQGYPNALITAGFIDGHVHYPQIPVIGAGGKVLLDWLEDYTFPMERRFAEEDHARKVAEIYFAENLRHGITTAAVFGTVHPASVDVFFEEAQARGLRMIAGKLLMDRNAPGDLLDTAQRGYDESKALLERWHGKDRLAYAITPRFAVTSSPAQLEAAGALKREFPEAYVQSHLSENTAEVAWVQELFPSSKSYLDVYASFGLTGHRTIFGHGIHLDEGDFAYLHETGTALAHCPTSNNFLGSGRFKLQVATRAERPVRVALATDLGGGTSFSMLRTMQAAYEVAQMSGHALPPACALYLATRGAAQALDLGERIGSLEPGYDADVTVLDLRSTPLIDHRMKYARDFDEVLAIQMALGDDRAIRATYIAGRLAHDRDKVTN